MVFHSQAHQVSCSSDVMVKIHLVDVGNDAFVARCKLVVALCQGKQSQGGISFQKRTFLVDSWGKSRSDFPPKTSPYPTHDPYPSRS
jgi:hypothetical protein